LTDLLTQYLHFAFSGMQEFCIACAPFLLSGMITKPLRDKPGQPSAKSPAKRKAKPAKQTKKTKAKKPKKKAKQKPQELYKAPLLSREQEAIFSAYRAKRDGWKDYSWAAGVPL
jgi:hypothetical protein